MIHSKIEDLNKGFFLYPQTSEGGKSTQIYFLLCSKKGDLKIGFLFKEGKIQKTYGRLFPPKTKIAVLQKEDCEQRNIKKEMIKEFLSDYISN